MTVTLNLYIVLAVVGWVVIGAVFARFLAISPIAVFVIVIAWPIFLLLLLLSPLINAYVNREFK